MSDPREPQQRCGTCRWWSDPGPGADWGGCDAPIPECVVVNERMGVSRDFCGQICPTWALRTTNKEQNHD